MNQRNLAQNRGGKIRSNESRVIIHHCCKSSFEIFYNSCNMSSPKIRFYEIAWIEIRGAINCTERRRKNENIFAGITNTHAIQIKNTKDISIGCVFFENHLNISVRIPKNKRNTIFSANHQRRESMIMKQMQINLP